ncbi:hypothetical protein ACLBKU_17070 [Erythrobacter sp. NE805]|uniref:hypothetical protein n=1 Tax=Erythrobacter sp. NE805 TaxID=3389875 RepID=UPI00396B0F26
MNARLVAAFGATAPLALRRALEDAGALLLSCEMQAGLFAELGLPDLPPANRADAMQLRAAASLYLASTLEAAGVIQAADDVVRLLRSGALRGDPGAAAPLVEAFWDDRHQRASEPERLALFDRLFGAPAGPQDLAAGSNQEFEELLLDLCDALMKAVEGGSQARVRAAALSLADNLAGAADGIVQVLAGEILASLSAAVAILNHEDLRTMLRARTMWEAVAEVDRKLRRPPRPMLVHLRRGRAGMALLAWLADQVERLEDLGGSPLVAKDDLVVDAAIDWIDETLSLVRAAPEGPAAASAPGTPSRAPVPSGWHELGR